jgi:hypothetical protein
MSAPPRPGPPPIIRCHYCERRIHTGQPRVYERKRGGLALLTVCPACAYRHERASS